MDLEEKTDPLRKLISMSVWNLVQLLIEFKGSVGASGRYAFH